MRLFFPVLALIILIIGLIFSLLNTQSAELFYFFGKVSLPVSLLIIGSFIIGILLGLFLGFILGLFRKIKKNKVKK